MAEEHSHNHEVITPVEASVPAAVETQDRGILDFLKKDEEKPAPAQAYAGEEALVAEFEKVEVSEPKVEEEEKIEEVKREGFLEKLHSDSSSSSSDEEEGSEKKEKKKKKKGLKEKIKEKITGEGDDKKSEEDTSVPIEKYEEGAAVAQPEEKKGFLEKIKEKLPGQKKTEEAPAAVVATEVQVEEPKEKKGILEKIKEKLPGYHPKTTEEVKEKEHGSD
uniref:Dehydrin 1 n=1 Tax=Impatiens walleriana TaxID=127142 RepID=A0A7S9VNF7_9ERIC|nr:dehydrin 1 [Impatiens walleriana]